MSRLLLLGLCVLACSCLTARLDRRPWQESAYYRQLTASLDSLPPPDAPGDTLRAGWARINITPKRRVHLAGYGSRFFKPSRGIHDSLFARAIVLSNGKNKVALLTADLLIMPPEVMRRLATYLPAQGWQLAQVYPMATHTHNGEGGWARKAVGRGIAGKYKRKRVKQLAAAFASAIRQAEAGLEVSQLAYVRREIANAVEHRISDSGSVDRSLRCLFLQKKSGARAVMAVFQAHATNLSDPVRLLSGDYPAALVGILEKDGGLNFAAFAAGGVASHAPRAAGHDFEKVAHLSQTLADEVLEATRTPAWHYTRTLQLRTLPLPLHRPEWRVGRDKCLRPWVFYALYGRYEAQIKALRLGEMYWAGMPCDFSGELTLEIEKKIVPRTLIVTSFNGGYIGYITADRYYDSGHYETQVMNWFGPGNGAYLSEAIRRLTLSLSPH